MTTQAATPRQNSTLRRELRWYQPRRFNAVTRERFLRDRRRRYRARITGEPTDSQAALILSLAALEWAALEAEHRFGDLTAAREAREHRRLFQRLLADFERSVAPPAPASADPMAALRTHIAKRHADPPEAA